LNKIVAFLKAFNKNDIKRKNFLCKIKIKNKINVFYIYFEKITIFQSLTKSSNKKFELIVFISFTFSRLHIFK